MAAPRPRMPHPRTTKVLVVLGSLFLALAAAEAGFRLLGPVVGVDAENLADFQRVIAGRGLLYVPRPHTVFARPPAEPFANERGFNDDEWKLEKTPGVLRIACLGGSTTEGGNPSGRHGSYPWQLERALERRTGREFEVMNCGISGWTTAETLVAWFLTIQDFDPDLVIVHHAVNDVTPRNSNAFRADYSHWRHPWTPSRVGAIERALIGASDLFAWLRMEGREHADIAHQTTYPQAGPLPYGRDGFLPPDTAAPFRRNVESIGLSAETRGADVLLLTMPLAPPGTVEPELPVYRDGTREHNAILRELAEEHGWLLVDAALWPEREPDEAAPLFLDLAHLTKEGNVRKASMVADVLVSQWLPARGSPGD